MQEKREQLMRALGISDMGSDGSLAEKLKARLDPQQQKLAEQLMSDPKAAAEFMKSEQVRELLSLLNKDKGG